MWVKISSPVGVTTSPATAVAVRVATVVAAGVTGATTAAGVAGVAGAATRLGGCAVAESCGIPLSPTSPRGSGKAGMNQNAGREHRGCSHGNVYA
jgi:hypothetical protein